MGAHSHIKKTLLSAGVISTVALAGCGANTDTASSSSSPSQEGGTVEVFAAASLNSAGAELEKAYEKEHPGVDVSFNLAGSSKLVQQVQQGATPDVLITADQKTMDGARTSVEDLKESEPKVIATNRLVLATSAGNPGKISAVKDLASESVTTAICAAEVPCGNLAHQELDKQHVELGNATEEKNVSDVSTKVASGAVDAGFIYSTDAAYLKKDQDITVIDLPGLEDNVYPMALTNLGKQNSVASDFATWLSGDEAQKIMSQYNFGSAK